MEGGTFYRSLTTMSRTVQSSKGLLGTAAPRRRRGDDRLRSSDDGSASRSKFWETGGGGSSGELWGAAGGLFSLSSSLLPGSHDGPALAAPSSHSPASPSPAPSRRQRRHRSKGEWTAADRARRVAGDPALRRLLALECEGAGVVTAAGYRAVHQRFLYGEAVEMEMERSQRGGGGGNGGGRGRGRKIGPKRASGRLGSLFSSMGAGSADRPPHDDGESPAVAVAKLPSSGSEATAEDGGRLRSNIAPRRTSQAEITGSMLVKIQREAQEHRDRERGKLNMDSFFADLDRKEEEEEGEDDEEEEEEDEGHGVRLSGPAELEDEDPLAPPSPRGSFLSDAASDDRSPRRRLPPLGRQESDRSLDLQDIFDGTGGSRLVIVASPHPDDEDVYPTKENDSNARQTSGFTATCATLSSRRDASASCFHEVDFDPDGDDDDGGDRGREGLGSSQGSYDACGWLPWPGQDDDDDDDDEDCDGSRNAGDKSDRSGGSDARGGELIESFLSVTTTSAYYDDPYDERESFRPWPRARAA